MARRSAERQVESRQIELREGAGPDFAALDGQGIGPAASRDEFARLQPGELLLRLQLPVQCEQRMQGAVQHITAKAGGAQGRAVGC